MSTLRALSFSGDGLWIGLSDQDTEGQFVWTNGKFRLVERICINQSRKENPQKPTQLSSRSHPRHLVGKRTAQKTPS